MSACLESLAGFAALAGAPAGGPPQVERLFTANGVSRALSALPFDASAARRLGESSAVAGLLATIRRRLDLDLLSPGAAPRLERALLRLSGAGALPPLPAVRPESLARMARISAAALPLKAVGIDVFSPGAGAQLGSWLARPQVAEARAAFAAAPLRAATLDGALRLAGAAPALALPPGARLDALARAPLAALWPRISGGESSASFKLPSLAAARERNAGNAACDAIERAAGLDRRDPHFDRKLAALSTALDAGGICRAARAHAIPAAEIAGLNRFGALRSAADAVRTHLGVDLLAKDAGPKLERALAAAPVPGRALAAPPDALAALGRLAEIAMAWG